MATVPKIYVQLLQYVVTIQCKILTWENFDELHVTSYTMTLPKILISLQQAFVNAIIVNISERGNSPYQNVMLYGTLAIYIYCILIFSYSFFITIMYIDM